MESLARKKRRRNTCGQVQSQKETWKKKAIYYTVLFLRVALWLAFAWALSYLHMGAPCFLLAVLMWLYSQPLQALFSWAHSHAFKRQPKKDH